MKAVVDADTCIGCSVCEGVCPEVFEMTDDEIAIVKVDPVPADAEEACKEAAEQCPVEAISLDS